MQAAQNSMLTPHADLVNLNSNVSISRVFTNFLIAISASAISVYSINTGVVLFFFGFLTIICLATFRNVSFVLTFTFISICFNNIIVSINANSSLTGLEFAVSQSVNFLASVIYTFLLLLLRPKPLEIRWTYLGLSGAFLGFFWIYGLAVSDFNSATAYLRQSAMPLMAIVMAAVLKDRIKRPYFISFCYLVSVLYILLIFFEVFFTRDYFELINLTDYMALKRPLEANLHDIDILIETSLRSFLNLTGVLQFDFLYVKILGPNLHGISAAYVLSVLCVYFFFVRRYALFLFMFLCMLAVSAKGPLIIVIMSAIYLVIFDRSRYRKQISLLMIGAYFLVFALYGAYTNDLHFQGLLKGSLSIFSNPVGYGFGVGGNSSTLALTMKDHATYLREGIPFAIESAAGVLFYQTGILGLIYFFCLLHAARLVIRAGRNDRAERYFDFAVIMLFVNSMFQEEAFSPACIMLGMLTFAIASKTCGTNENAEKNQKDILRGQ